jgi:hypothetical protein
MAATKPVDFLAQLRCLVGHGVNFIVVGGVSAVLQGVPMTTLDLDIVHERTSDNLMRLVTALRTLEAYYRGRGTQRLYPDQEHLASEGHHLLMTNAGPLDVLGIIGAERSYEDLLSHTERLTIHGLELLVLDLETQIKVKEEVAHEKDQAALPLLRRALHKKLEMRRGQ